MEKGYKLTILFIVLWGLSCNNQTNNDNANDKDPINAVKTERNDQVTFLEGDTSQNKNKQDFTYQPAENITTQASDNFKGFSAFYKQFDKPYQTIKVPAKRDTAIICNEGTTIKIKANSFINSKTGYPVIGDIDFRIKEFYRTSDILFANLNTMSNGNILETGGMLYIEIESKGDRCELKKGSTIDIGFPTKDKKNNMQLFSGKWKNESQVNWMVIADSKDLNKIYTFSQVDEKPTFRGGHEEMYKYLSRKLRYPPSIKGVTLQGTVYLSFTVNEDGSINNTTVTKGINLLLNQAAILAINQMPNWKAGKQNGKYVKVSYTLPIRFYNTPNKTQYSTDDSQYTEVFDQAINDGNIKEIEMSDIGRYLFSSSKLGWINCDRFYEDDRPKVNYFVDIKKSKHIDIKVVFNNINSILTGSIKNNKYCFDNVPEGQKVTLVALKYDNDQYYLAIKQTQIESNGESELTFEPVTIDRLKTEMQKLNRI